MKNRELVINFFDAKNNQVYIPGFILPPSVGDYVVAHGNQVMYQVKKIVHYTTEGETDVHTIDIRMGRPLPRSMVNG